VAQEPAYAGPSEAATTIPPTNTLLNSCISVWAHPRAPSQAGLSDRNCEPAHFQHCRTTPLVHFSTAASGRDHLCPLPIGQRRAGEALATPTQSNVTNPNPTLRTSLRTLTTTPTGSRAVPDHAGPPFFTLHDPLGPPTLPLDMFPCPQGGSA